MSLPSLSWKPPTKSFTDNQIRVILDAAERWFKVINDARADPSFDSHFTSHLADFAKECKDTDRALTECGYCPDWDNAGPVIENDPLSNAVARLWCITHGKFNPDELEYIIRVLRGHSAKPLQQPGSTGVNINGPFAKGCFRWNSVERTGIGPKQWRLLEILWDHEKGQPKAFVENQDAIDYVYGHDGEISDEKFRELRRSTSENLTLLGLPLEVSAIKGHATTVLKSI